MKDEYIFNFKMGIKKVWIIIRWRLWELIFLFSLCFAPAWFLKNSFGSGVGITVSATLLGAILVPRFFDHLRKLEKHIETLKLIRSLTKVWLEGIETLSGRKWLEQLEWLKRTYKNRRNRVK